MSFVSLFIIYYLILHDWARSTYPFPLYACSQPCSFRTCSFRHILSFANLNPEPIPSFLYFSLIQDVSGVMKTFPSTPHRPPSAPVIVGGAWAAFNTIVGAFQAVASRMRSKPAQNHIAYSNAIRLANAACGASNPAARHLVLACAIRVAAETQCHVDGDTGPPWLQRHHQIAVLARVIAACVRPGEPRSGAGVSETLKGVYAVASGKKSASALSSELTEAEAKESVRKWVVLSAARAVSAPQNPVPRPEEYLLALLVAWCAVPAETVVQSMPVDRARRVLALAGIPTANTGKSAAIKVLSLSPGDDFCRSGRDSTAVRALALNTTPTQPNSKKEAEMLCNTARAKGDAALRDLARRVLAAPDQPILQASVALECLFCLPESLAPLVCEEYVTGSLARDATRITEALSAGDCASAQPGAAETGAIMMARIAAAVAGGAAAAKLQNAVKGLADQLEALVEAVEPFEGLGFDSTDRDAATALSLGVVVRARLMRALAISGADSARVLDDDGFRVASAGICMACHPLISYIDDSARTDSAFSTCVDMIRAICASRRRVGKGRPSTGGTNPRRIALDKLSVLLGKKRPERDAVWLTIARVIPSSHGAMVDSDPVARAVQSARLSRPRKRSVRGGFGVGLNSNKPYINVWDVANGVAEPESKAKEINFKYRSFKSGEKEMWKTPSTS